MNDHGPQRTLEHLSRSALYRDFKRAFADTMGLPLNLVPVNGSPLADCGRPSRIGFCALLAKRSPTCANCLQTQPELTSDGATSPRTATCFAGFCQSTVPIRTGSKLLGFLHTGEVATRKPSQQEFVKIRGKLQARGVQTDGVELKDAYFSTRVMPPARYRSMLDLLTVFAGHLSLVAGQTALHSEQPESPQIMHARQYIDEHKSEPLALTQVAGAVQMGTFYFCKKFKAATGFTFTEYVTRVRLEVAKKRLLHPQARISEVAFEAGFQSLTHFNRVFKAMVGQSPTEYRAALPKAV